MKSFLLVFLATVVLLCASGCASFAPDLPSGEEQQLDRPGTLSGPPPADPLATPDEATLPHVPGQ